MGCWGWWGERERPLPPLPCAGCWEGVICPCHLLSGQDGSYTEGMPGIWALTVPGLAPTAMSSPLGCPWQQIILIFSVNSKSTK